MKMMKKKKMVKWMMVKKVIDLCYWVLLFMPFYNISLK